MLSPLPTDNAPAISAALATGYCELIPGAEFTIASQITVADLNNLTLIGNGAEIIAAPSMPKEQNMLLLQNCQNVLIDRVGMGADRQRRGWYDSKSILLNWCKNVVIQRSAFRDALSDGIFAWGGAGCPAGPCQGIQVIGCEFTNPGRNCISWINTLYTLVDGCIFNDVSSNDPATAIDLECNWSDPVGCNSYATIRRNTFNNCQRAVFAQNINNTNPVGFDFSENTVNGGLIGCETQWAGIIARNRFNNLKSFPICTGSYPGAVGSRIFDNAYSGCLATSNALDPRDIAV